MCSPVPSSRVRSTVTPCSSASDYMTAAPLEPRPEKIFLLQRRLFVVLFWDIGLSFQLNGIRPAATAAPRKTLAWHRGKVQYKRVVVVVVVVGLSEERSTI